MCDGFGYILAVVVVRNNAYIIWKVRPLIPCDDGTNYLEAGEIICPG